MTLFSKAINGTVKCAGCKKTIMHSEKTCPCGIENLLRHIPIDELGKISTKKYDKKVLHILETNGVKTLLTLERKSRTLKINKLRQEGKNRSIRKTNTRDEAQSIDNVNSPNGTVIYGILFTIIAVFSGDIAGLIFGSKTVVLQQIALSIGVGFFGLGLLLLGSFKAVIIRLDKLLENSDP